jgi:hypothetical protein
MMTKAFAKLDDNNKVIHIHTIPDSWDDGTDTKGQNYLRKLYGDPTGVYKRTDPRTVAGTHIDGGTPYRKNYAGKGMTYDPVRDAFLRNQSFPSWILNEDTGDYEAPIPPPNGFPTQKELYDWNEVEKKWELRN